MFMSLKTRLGFYLLIFAVLASFGVAGFYYNQFRNFKEVTVKKNEPSVPIVNKESLSRLVAQCNQGDAETCLSIGYIYLRGIIDQDQRDFKQASNYFEKACNGFKDLNRKQLQCEAIAKIFENGKEARPDRKFAAIFHEKAEEARKALLKESNGTDEEINSENTKCAEGQISSCFHLGENYLKPDHLDVKRAEAVLLKTCDKGMRKSDPSSGEEYPGKFCGLVAELFEYGHQGLPQDLDKAGKIYELACDLAADSPVQNGFMCDLAGNFFRDKKNNQRLAAALYKKGCKLGLQDSCDHLKKIGLLD
jgi:TPR repeat protein